MSSIETPLPKEGWLRKLARSGLVKNWQNRYFVLENGKISYYQQQLHAFPNADNLKGELFLAGAKISSDKKKYSDKQVFIIGHGQKDLLIEAENASDASAWAEAIARHIAFAPSVKNQQTNPLYTADGGSFEGVEEGKLTSNRSLTEDNGTTIGRESDELGTSGANSVSIIPKPAWVIKVLRTNGEKIFINLCEHAEVPMIPLVLSIGYNKWPLMVLTPPRTLRDEKGEDGTSMETTVYDAIVNPAVVSICLKDSQAKDATCARVMRLLKKNYGEDLQSEFRLPKITKKYKGEIANVLLPANIGALSKKRSSIFAAYNANKPGSTASPGAALSNRSPFAGDNDEAADAGQGIKWLERNNSNFQREDSVNSVSPVVSRTASSRATVSRSRSLTPFSETQSPMTSNRGQAAAAAATHNALLNDPALQGLSEAERRTTLAKLFPGVSFDEHALDNMGNNNSSNKSTNNLKSITPVKIDHQPLLSRTHTEMNYESAGLARSGLARKSVRSSLTNPLVEGYQLAGVTDAQRKLVIPFQIVRSNGTVARQQPDKLSSGRVLAYGVKVFVVARKINYAEQAVWLKTTEGWIMDKFSPPTNGTSRAVSVNSAPSSRNNLNNNARILVPTLYQSVVSIRIVSTRFEQAGSHVNGEGPISRQSTSGWNIFRPSAIREGFQTRFVFEVMQLDNAMLRISRTFGEVLLLREALLNFPNKAVKDRTLKAGTFPLDDDNEPDLVEDVHLLLEVIESVENWFNKLIALQVERTKCKAFSEFLAPREKPDYELMDLELMAKDGLGGAWGDGSS